MIAATQPITQSAAAQLANPMVVLRLLVVIGMLALAAVAVSKSDSPLWAEASRHIPR